jgi:hypothetical protein
MAAVSVENTSGMFFTSPPLELRLVFEQVEDVVAGGLLEPLAEQRRAIDEALGQQLSQEFSPAGAEARKLARSHAKLQISRSMMIATSAGADRFRCSPVARTPRSTRANSALSRNPVSIAWASRADNASLSPGTLRGL